jgi:hypothetical protein
MYLTLLRGEERELREVRAESGSDDGFRGV